MRTLCKNSVLFLIGGLIYQLIEMVYKTFVSGGLIHWSMIVVGGLCFLLLGLINEYLPWEMGLPKQAAIGTVIVTIVEFVAGYIINLRMGLGVWDYSGLPLNIMGQVCVPFMVAWLFLSVIGIVLDDYLRYKLFGEEKPHYHWSDHDKCDPYTIAETDIWKITR